jgi:GTPase-associated protein 1, N-terminal domain type 1
VKIHQALYGYEEGHRLLSSSMPIVGAAGRQLRGLTDASFDDADGQYLTVAPIPDLRCHAVIRTWPAPESDRPGSVWSHALLIDHVDLAAAERLDWVLKLFVRPRPSRINDSAGGRYDVPLTLSAPSASRVPPVETPPGTLAKLADAVYGQRHDAVVQSTQLRELESALVALWEQQWPRLRRAFSCRTRHRAAASKSVHFDLQVVERLGRGQQAHEPINSTAFLRALVDDLMEPNPELRRWLRAFGAQADRGRADMAPLITILEMAWEGRAHETIAELCEEYPEARMMTALKHALLGPRVADNPLWSLTERGRLQEIVAAPPAALDLEDLSVAERLAALWHHHHRDALRLLATLDDDREQLQPAERLLVESAFEHVAARDMAALASSNSALAMRIIASRDDLMQAPEVWRHASSYSVAATIAASAEAAERAALFAALLSRGVVEGLEALVTIQPSLWWQALAALAEDGVSDDHIALAGQLVSAVGAAAVGSPPTKLSPLARVLLAAATDPADGLWRQIDAKAWAQAANEAKPAQRLRVLSIGLAATRSAGSADIRRRLWANGFGPLHEALALDGLDDGSWKLLNSVLPHLGDDDWDRCHRLRAGAVSSIKRDQWSASAVHAALEAVGDAREEMIAALTPKKKAKKGWLRDIVDHLLP